MNLRKRVKELCKKLKIIGHGNSWGSKKECPIIISWQTGTYSDDEVECDISICPIVDIVEVVLDEK